MVKISVSTEIKVFNRNPNFNPRTRWWGRRGCSLLFIAHSRKIKCFFPKKETKKQKLLHAFIFVLVYICGGSPKNAINASELDKR